MWHETKACVNAVAKFTRFSKLNGVGSKNAEDAICGAE
jgi:hypothetical protein